jgi:hypothetical protein
LRKILALFAVVFVVFFDPANAATMKATKPLVELPYTKSDQVSDVLLTPVSILLVGTTESTNSTWISGALGGLSDGFIASYSSIGAPMWNLRLGGASDEIATAAAIDNDGSIWVLGASSTPATATTSTIPPKVLNPDNVIINPDKSSTPPLNRIKIWQIGSTGNLLNSFEFLVENIVNPRKILISGGNLLIIGNLYEKNSVAGFSTSVTKSGSFSPIVKVGSKGTSLSDAIINSDGSLTVVGSSSELLMKAKPLGKADAVTLKISTTGELQQVARATLKGTTRNWSSIDSGLLQAGKVSYSNKTEAAITKFSALNKPVWNVRYLSKSSALATASKNSWATFVSAGAIKNISAWKPKSSTAVVLELGKKGEILSAYTLAAPAVAITSNNEIGTVVITDSGVSFGLVVVN